jgi:O-antigen ligase
MMRAISAVRAHHRVPVVASSTALPARERATLFGITLAIAWGVAVFGAVHTIPLAILGVITIVTAVSMVDSLRPADRRAAGFAALLVAVASLQILPLPSSVIHPLAHRTLYARQMEWPHGWEALSISVQQTTRAVACASVLSAFCVCLVGWLREHPYGATAIARNVSIVGTVVAVEAIVQKGTFNGKIYWFWESQWRAQYNYFGPFVNRNHFAGWMILAGSVTAGWLVAQISVAASHSTVDWRRRLLWWSSAEAGAIMMTAAGLLVMVVSLVWTMSRSGIAGASVALLIIVAVAAFRMKGARKLIGPALIIAVLVIGVLSKGADALAAWYGTTDTLTWRFVLWKDTVSMLRDYWLLGSGLNTYGILTWVYPMTNPVPHAYEAHNDYLQLVVEGGLLMCATVLIVVIAGLRVIRARLIAQPDDPSRWIRIGAIAGLTGIALQELTDFSLQIPGVALLFVVVFSLALHDRGSSTYRWVPRS